MIGPYDPPHPDGPDDPETLPCSACGQPAASWVYAVSIGEDGMTVIDGQAVCEAHRAAA